LIYQAHLSVRDRWSIEGNGAAAMATLRTAALNLLRLAGLQLIRAGLQAVMHDITALLAIRVSRRSTGRPCILRCAANSAAQRGARVQRRDPLLDQLGNQSLEGPLQLAAPGWLPPRATR